MQEEDQGKPDIGFSFHLGHADDVLHAVISRRDRAQREGMTETYAVLRALADYVQQELHIREDYPDFMGDISAFHERYQLAYAGLPRSLATEVMPGEDKTLFDFRYGFMMEELKEWYDEQENLNEKVEKGDDGGVTKYLELQLDALCDLTYVVLGTAYLQFGAGRFNEAWRRVHHANMQKVRAARGGDSKRGSTFDVVKPSGWTPPSHTDLVERHAHITLDPPVETGMAIETNTANREA
jgi:predicted HAD superfamily Cof-like phosphohydrolase